jgi:hypothetical protein
VRIILAYEVVPGDVLRLLTRVSTRDVRVTSASRAVFGRKVKGGHKIHLLLEGTSAVLFKPLEPLELVSGRHPPGTLEYDRRP